MSIEHPDDATPAVEDSPAWSAAAPAASGTPLAKEWFAASLRAAGVDAGTRRGRFGVGRVAVPQARDEFVARYAPRVDDGVRLQR